MVLNVVASNCNYFYEVLTTNFAGETDHIIYTNRSGHIETIRFSTAK